MIARKNVIEIGIGSSVGVSSLISGTVAEYASLPDASLYENKVYFVTSNSGGTLAILGVYKYPKGLYISDGSTWEQMPISVKVSEDATTLVNITSWSDFYDYAQDINEGDWVIYTNIPYKNLTGAMTSTSPDTDTTNWYSYEQLMLLNDQIEVEDSGDDAGVNFVNQVSCEGEIIAGTDSYPVPIAFQCDIANTSGTTITDATDVTEILQSDSGSTTGFFGGTTAGSYILVGSSQIFEGAKVKYDTLDTVEPDNITTEYYQDSTNEWQSVSFMAVDNSYPFNSQSYNIALSDTEQIYFGFNPLIRDEDSTWEQSTQNINGTDYTYYWARFRITSDITGDPIVEQAKLHTNRIEFEDLGIFKYGRARSPLYLNHIMVKNANSDPVDESVDYTPQYSAAFEDNELATNATDGFGVIVNRIWGLDTSVPLLLNLSFYVNGTATGDIYLNYEVSQVVDNFVYDGTEPYDSYTYTHTISTSQDLERFTIQLPCQINKLESNSAIVVNVYRDATDALDTLNASIVNTNISVTGYAWKI